MLDGIQQSAYPVTLSVTVKLIFRNFINFVFFVIHDSKNFTKTLLQLFTVDKKTQTNTGYKQKPKHYPHLPVAEIMDLVHRPLKGIFTFVQK